MLLKLCSIRELTITVITLHTSFAEILSRIEDSERQMCLHLQKQKQISVVFVKIYCEKEPNMGYMLTFPNYRFRL